MATRAFQMRHRHQLPGGAEPIEQLVVGAMGVFVMRTAATTRRARAAQAHELRRETRTVRATLDAAGLRALPVTPLLRLPTLDGRPPRVSGGVLTGDLTAILAHLESETRFGRSTVRAALLALDPPPFVADIRPPAEFLRGDSHSGGVTDPRTPSAVAQPA